MSTPTLPAALRSAFDRFTSDVHVAIPGQVTAYDSAKQACSVQPLIERAFTDERGDRVTEPLPIVNDVPVCFPGTGAYAITWPVKPGDTVLLVFSEGSLDKWLTRGGLVDPRDDRRFSLSDAVAIPGLRPFPSALAGARVADAVVISTDTEIHAGGTAQLATKADLDALISTFNAHVHQSSTPSAPTSPPVAAGSMPITAYASSTSPGVPPFDVHKPGTGAAHPISTGTQVLKGA